jgi:hypothetical protein
MLKGALETISKFFENKTPRWPRIAFPAVAIFIILWREKWIELSIVSFPVILTSSLVTGGIIYYIYFVTIHKLLRAAAYYTIGLETYDLTIEILRREKLLSDGISPFKIQALLGSFFLEYPNTRKAETVLMSSIFHGLYMISIIAFLYFCIKFITEPLLTYSGAALLCFFCILFVSWCDSTFGENAECLAIQRNIGLFADHLRSCFEPYPRSADAG